MWEFDENADLETWETTFDITIKSLYFEDKLGITKDILNHIGRSDAVKKKLNFQKNHFEVH